MATIELDRPVIAPVAESAPDKGNYSVKVVSFGRGKRTAQVIVTPSKGGRPFTRHLVRQLSGNYTDRDGRGYAVPAIA